MRRSRHRLRHVADVTAFMAGEWWSGIEMRHLVALDAVAREGSFRRAATRLGYVQSAISHQIAALEGLIGKRLIDRSRGTRPLALTPAGEILLAHADALIARVRAAQADLAALDGEGVAALRVGATPDLLARLVPSFLRAYGAPVTLHETPGDANAARRADPGRARPRARRDAAAQRATRRCAALRRLVRRRSPGRCSARRAPAAGHVQASWPAAADRSCADARARRGAASHTRHRAAVRARGGNRRRRARARRGRPRRSGPASPRRRRATARDVVLDLAPGVVANRTVAVVWSRMQPPRADAAAFVESARSACAGEGLREPLLAG